MSAVPSCDIARGPMTLDGAMSALTTLAAHNEWANRRIFAACSDISSAKLKEATHGYDSVIEILKHLVQVQHSFFELAHGRQPQKVQVEELTELGTECARIDRAYVDYVGTLGLPDAQTTKQFLVPWFGFEISLMEGVLQPLTHSHKHRADISMLLPRLGGTGIEMDLIQWFDEERGQR
ncbi:MAG: DinB family protein [Actinomycetota bacterium]